MTGKRTASRRPSSPPGTARRAPQPDPPAPTSSDAPLDTRDVALQARKAVGGGRANLAGAVRPDGVLRVFTAMVGDPADLWRRSLELARDDRPVVAEVDVNGNVRLWTEKPGPDATPFEVDLSA